MKPRKNIQLPVAVLPSKFSNGEKRAIYFREGGKKAEVGFVGRGGERGVEVG